MVGSYLLCLFYLVAVGCNLCGLWVMAVDRCWLWLVVVGYGWLSLTVIACG